MNLMGKIDNILKNDLGLKICATHLLEKKKRRHFERSTYDLLFGL